MGKHITADGRARMAAAGARNLARWVAEHRGESNRRHGINGLIARGTLPPDSDATITRADALIGQAMDELGGAEKLTAKQKMILESQRMALRVTMLIGDYVAVAGLLDTRRGRPHPLLTCAVSFANSLRLNLEMLGLGDAHPAGVPPSDASPEARREWAKKYVAGLVNEDRSTPQ